MTLRCFGMVQSVVPSGVCLTVVPTSFAFEWENPASELILCEEEIPATKFGPLSLPSGGLPSYIAMLSEL